MPNQKKETQRSSYTIFFVMLLFSLILEIIHFPAWLSEFRPNFTILVVIFFAVADPNRINVGIAWICGIVLDLLTGAPFGLNAMSFVTLVWVVVTQFRHFVFFERWQQILIIGLITTINNIITFWLEHVFGDNTQVSSFVYQAIANMVCWPVIYWICVFLWSILGIGNADNEENNGI